MRSQGFIVTDGTASTFYYTDEDQITIDGLDDLYAPTQTFDATNHSNLYMPQTNDYARMYNSYCDEWNRERRGSRRITDEDEPDITVPLMELPLEKFKEISRFMEQEYNEAIERRNQEMAQYRLDDERAHRDATREFWNDHRRQNPDCDCERCLLYRGLLDEEYEDDVGW